MNRRTFRKALKDKCGCSIQHDGWPCNTCFHSMELGLDDDRQHELWQSVLAYRGDYKDVIFDPPQTPGLIDTNLKELAGLL